MELETRYNEFRYDKAKRTVTGYGAVFYDPRDKGTEFQLSSTTWERIHPDAFDNSLKKNNIKLHRMHERNQGLARTPTTLQLEKDRKGIKYTATLPNTTIGRDTAEEIESDYLRGASVGMRIAPDGIKFSQEGTRRIATIMQAQLVDISIVDDGAYASCSAILRMADAHDMISVDEM